MLYLVRHAKAGSRRQWDGDDRQRPLNDAGWRQANALVTTIGADLRSPTATAPAAAPRSLSSSPYARCRQTLEPLADHLGVGVRDDGRLAEGTPFEETLAMLYDLADGAVCCSHGDVIPNVIAALERRGMRIRGEPDWRKATTWVLERRPEGFVGAHVLPPPLAR